MDLDSINSDLSSLLKSDNGCEYTDVEDGKLRCIKSSKNLNILHLNIRSLSRNKDALLMLLGDLREHGVIIHAIGLCETFLTKESADMMHFENYQAIHDCRPNKPGGGTTLLIHDSVNLVKKIPSPFSEYLESTVAEVSYMGKRILLTRVL